MEFLGEIEYKAPYYTCTSSEVYVTAEHYNKFVNWVSGEFDLYLQDESNGIEVFFPSGRLYIKNVAESNDQVYIDVVVYNKSKKEVEKISSQVSSIYSQTKKITGKPEALMF